MARTEDRSTSRALRTWRERLFDAAPEGQDGLLYPSMYRGRLWTMR